MAAKGKLKTTEAGVVYKTVNLPYMCLHPDAIRPEKKTEGAIGFDIGSTERVVVLPTKISKTAYRIPTGIAVEIPEGYYGSIHLRSSIGANTKLRLANQTGIIDSDYRGEIVLLIENVGSYQEVIEPGERIAQFILCKGEPVELQEKKELTKTKRGTKGIGSTGKK